MLAELNSNSREQTSPHTLILNDGAITSNCYRNHCFYVAIVSTLVTSVQAGAC